MIPRERAVFVTVAHLGATDAPAPPPGEVPDSPEGVDAPRPAVGWMVRRAIAASVWAGCRCRPATRTVEFRAPDGGHPDDRKLVVELLHADGCCLAPPPGDVRYSLVPAHR